MLTLTDFDISDFPKLSEWIHSEKELVQFAGTYFQYPLTVEQFEEYLREPRRQVLKVMCSGRFIGIAELFDLSDEASKIARVLIGDKSMRGQGIGAKLIARLVELSRQHGKAYVTLNVYDWNTQAISCYQKVGFEFTNRAPKITQVAGEEWRSIEMRLDFVGTIS